MSEIRVTTISDTAGTGPVTLTKQEGAKARCTFDASSTIAINESFNVSSMTDNGVGSYNANFSSNFSSIHYAYTFANNSYMGGASGASNASSARMFTYTTSFAQADTGKNMIMAIGDLA